MNIADLTIRLPSCQNLVINSIQYRQQFLACHKLFRHERIAAAARQQIIVNQSINNDVLLGSHSLLRNQSDLVNINSATNNITPMNNRTATYRDVLLGSRSLIVNQSIELNVNFATDNSNNITPSNNCTAMDRDVLLGSSTLLGNQSDQVKVNSDTDNCSNNTLMNSRNSTLTPMNSCNTTNREFAGTDTSSTDTTNTERNTNQDEHDTGNTDNAREGNDVLHSCQNCLRKQSPFLIEKYGRESLYHITFVRHRSDGIIRCPFKINNNSSSFDLCHIIDVYLAPPETWSTSFPLLPQFHLIMVVILLFQPIPRF